MSKNTSKEAAVINSSTAIRFGNLQLIYEIIKDEILLYQKSITQIDEYKACGKEINLVTFKNKDIGLLQWKHAKEINIEKLNLNKSKAKIIIFTCMYLEAFIYDYAAVKMGDTFVKSLEKLDLKNKWKIIPRLGCGYDINFSDNQFRLFGQIISERNQLIHSKTKDIKVVTVELKKDDKNKIELKDCISCLKFMIGEINRIDPIFNTLINHFKEIKTLNI